MREELALEMTRYRGDNTAAAYRTSIASPDSTNLASIGSIPIYDLREFESPQATGKTTLLIQARFSSSSGATSMALVKGYVTTYGGHETYANTFHALSIEPFTQVFSTCPINHAGVYWSAEQLADAFGCNYVKVLVFGQAAGTVDVWVRRV